MSDIRRRQRQPRGRMPHRSQNQNELDRFLEGKNLWRKHIAKDGSCLFRAVAEQVYLSQVDHLQVRGECVEYIRQHQAKFKGFLEEPVDSYLFKLCHPTSWGGEVELAALAEIYHRRIEVYHYHTNQVCIKSFGQSSSGEPTVLLAYSDGNHYDSVMTKEYRNNSAICQSILYELLYKCVLKQAVPNRKDLQVYSRPQKDYLGDTSLRNFCPDDLMAFSSKVYFNAALGVHKTYKEDLESQDWHLAMAMQFQEGDECQVWIDYRKEKKLYDGVIRAMNTSKGKHKVFIYDLKKTMEVRHQDFNVLSLVGGRKPSHVKNSDWLTQNKKKYDKAPSNAGRKDRGGQGKLSSERGHSKTYLTPGHSKKREHIIANNLGSDEEDPELQDQLRLIALQDKENSFPALSSQATKAVSEPYDHVPTLAHQPVTTSSTIVTTTAPVLVTAASGSLPSSAVPKVKPIQRQHKLPTTTTAVLVQPQVVSSKSQAVSTRPQPTNPQFVTSSNSPLSSSEESFKAKTATTTTTVPVTSVAALKSTVAAKGNHLSLHDGSVQHANVAKQLMQVIHQEKESQQSSERQLMTLSKPMSPTGSAEQHSSWPELLSQDELRATPVNEQEQQNIASPTFAPVSKPLYATQAHPTANTVTHMPSTAVRVAKAPPSFFTSTRAPPTTGQSTKATQATVVKGPVITTSVIQPTSANKSVSTATTTNQGTPSNRVHPISPMASQATPTTKAFSSEGLATPTTSRATPTQHHTYSVPVSAVKTSGYASATVAQPTSVSSTVAGLPKVLSPTTLEMPLVQLPKPPLQLFQDGENGYFFEQYGRMCFALLVQQCPDLAVRMHGIEAKLTGKTHSHDIDYSEEERRLIEEQSQRLETWKKSPSILHTMKELQGVPSQSDECAVNIMKSSGVPLGEAVSSQDGTRKLQIVFPSMKEPAQEEESTEKDFATQEKPKDCFKNLSKEELDMLHSLMKKLDLHQLQSEATGGRVSSEETISAQTTSSVPLSDTEMSTASETAAQVGSPIQTAPEPHPSESQSAESSSPDVKPSLQPTAEGPGREDTMMDIDAEKPGEVNSMEHQQENINGEGAAFTPGMIHPSHNPMAAMATMGPFIPPAAAAGFVPTMLPAPINPYMMAPQMYYYQMFQHAHYNQMLQQSMAAAAISSPTLMSDDGSQFFQHKSMDMMNLAAQDVDPVEVTTNTDRPNDEQLRDADLPSNQATSTIPSANMQIDQTAQGIKMAPCFTGTAPSVSSPLPLSSEENTSSGDSQLQYGSEEDQQITNTNKELLKIQPHKIPAPSESEPTGSNYKTNHSPRREIQRNYTGYHNSGGLSNGSSKTTNSTVWKQPQSNKQVSNMHKQQIQHHSRYDGDIIDHELSQIGLHNSFPDGIPSMEFSSDKRRKAQQT